jgi:hypothetical protein
VQRYSLQATERVRPWQGLLPNRSGRGGGVSRRKGLMD